MTEKFRKIIAWSCIGIYAVISILFHRVRIVQYIGLIALGVIDIGVSVIYRVTNKTLSKETALGEIITNVVILLAIAYIVSRMVRGI